MNLKAAENTAVVAMVTLLLGLFISQAGYNITNQSATFDEGAHITAGYHYLITGEFNLNPQNGLMPQAIAALPLMLLDLKPPEVNAISSSNRLWVISDSFMHNNLQSPQTILEHARWPIVILGSLIAVTVFIWSKKLWGNYGGLLSLLLCAVSPTLLAHSGLATSDVAACLGFLLALAAVWRMCHIASLLNVALCGFALAILALSKMSAILILPTILLLLGWRYYASAKTGFVTVPVLTGTETWKKLIPAFLAAFVVALFLINLAYSRDSGTENDITNLKLLSPFHQAWLIPLMDTGLLPDGYLYGLGYTLSHTTARLSFAFGQFSLEGWWWFFPYAFLIKTPLTILLLIPILFVYSVIEAKKNRTDKFYAKFYHAIPLVIFISLYLGFAIASGLNIGHRHLLPIYPPLFILLGALANNSLRYRRIYPAGIALMLGMENLSASPHHLAFFNQASGGPESGYQHLVDSSLDWGQDLPLLSSWTTRNQNRNIYLAYFGTAHPQAYGVDARLLPGFPGLGQPTDTSMLEPGTYVISATLLQLVFQPPEAYGPWNSQNEKDYQSAFTDHINRSSGYTSAGHRRYERLRFGKLCHNFRQRSPDFQLGYSLLGYHMSAADLQEALGSVNQQDRQQSVPE